LVSKSASNLRAFREWAAPENNLMMIIYILCLHDIAAWRTHNIVGRKFRGGHLCCTICMDAPTRCLDTRHGVLLRNVLTTSFRITTIIAGQTLKHKFLLQRIQMIFMSTTLINVEQYPFPVTAEITQLSLATVRASLCCLVALILGGVLGTQTREYDINYPHGSLNLQQSIPTGEYQAPHSIGTPPMQGQQPKGHLEF
jgi:hypothetical protein